MHLYSNVRRPKSDVPRKKSANININNLSSDEKRLLKNIIDQNQRSRGFIRIFPTYLSWKKYSSYLGKCIISVNIITLQHIYRSFVIYADNNNGIPRGSIIPPFYVKLIRNYNYFINDRLFNENSSYYMDISKQNRYERSLKDFKQSLNGY